MRFQHGQRVRITAGDASGNHGTVEFYDELFGLYVVRVDGRDGHRFGCQPDELVPGGSAPEFGMTSQQLADYVAEFIGRATARVTGVGDQQYSRDGFQKFEAIPLEELLLMLQEELQDAAVYAAMLDIRVQRYRDAMRGHE